MANSTDRRTRIHRLADGDVDPAKTTGPAGRASRDPDPFPNRRLRGSWWFALILLLGISVAPASGETERWVITDVKVANSQLGNGYSGVVYGDYSHNNGAKASDVNKGIGGTTTGIYVQYDKLDITDSTKILTGIRVQHWPHWDEACSDLGEGWVPANGTSAGIQGGLSTQTDNACYRTGLCVKYEAIDEASSYISHLTLTDSGDSSTEPDFYNGYQPRRAGIDIHKGCGDDHWVYLWNINYFLPGDTAAITDVKVVDSDTTEEALLEQGYTGLRTDEVTLSNGTPMPGSDVNSGIGGSDTRILVKYEDLELTSLEPVLTGIWVQHWPYWKESCDKLGEGWEPAGGTSRGIQGALSTGTDGACWRNGLCVRYQEMEYVETFVSNLGLTKAKDADPPKAPRPGNGAAQKAGIDIHRECGDDEWVYVWAYPDYRTAEGVPAYADITEDEKIVYLTEYAPRVYLAEGESYLPSSVEWAQQYLERTELTGEDFERYIVADTDDRERLYDDPQIILDFFEGPDFPTSPGQQPPAYSFFVGKEGAAIYDLVYFFWYPYNRGKEAIPGGRAYGNHVGDWEHIYIRLQWSFADEEWTLVPYAIYISAHNFGGLHPWSAPSKTTDGHPIVYAAKGSHGLWLTSGDHSYIGLASWIVDECSQGTSWDTWHNLETYEYTARAGLGDSQWPEWMTEGYIKRWGDAEHGSCLPIIDECELVSGPTGPVDKNVWGLDP